MKYLLTLVCSFLLFVSCNNDDEQDVIPKPEKTSRSVMVYMSGENNLTATNGYKFLRTDLNEIIEGSKSMADDQRLFVFVDSLSNKKTDKPCIIEVHGGNVTTCKTYSSDFYACDPAKFEEILQWMVTNAPADSYGLVLWGHATGWLVSNDTIAQAQAREITTRAYGMDYGTDNIVGEGTKWMNITQMARALENIPKLEFIFADCCNMMSAEVGYELRNATNYLIGSPAEIPGEGAPYNKVVPYFFKSGSEQYKGIIDTYFNYYLEGYQSNYHQLSGNSLPLSVIETKYMEQLAQATHDVLDKFNGGYPVYPKYADPGDIVFYWYFDTPVMYDMKAFIQTNVPEEDFLKWEQAFKLAVPYYRMSMEWMSNYADWWYFSKFNKDESLNGCVSMFIPQNTNLYRSSEFQYNKRFTNLGWNRVLEWSRYGW